MKVLEARMQAHAGRMEFEQAAELRDRVHRLRRARLTGVLEPESKATPPKPKPRPRGRRS